MMIKREMQVTGPQIITFTFIKTYFSENLI